MAEISVQEAQRQLGIKPGSYDNLGWYPGKGGGSYQYNKSTNTFWNVSGAIHGSSNQVGAGQKVSNEVIAQTAAQQGKTFEEQKSWIDRTPQAVAPSNFGSTQDVTEHLNSLQTGIYDKATSPGLRFPSLTELTSALKPSTPAPAPINRAEERQKLRLELGVADLEESLNSLKAQEEEAYAALRTLNQDEEGKPLPLNVIGGRQQENIRKAQENIDFIRRQKQTIADELNTKYQVIGEYVQDLGLDYQDAVDAYDREFNTNVKMYEIFRQERQDAISEVDRIQTAAKANLQIYMNAVTAGNLDYNSLSMDQKVLISKLEAQAGLPVGTVSQIKMSAKDRMLFNYKADDGTVQIGVMGEDGKVNIQTLGTPTKSTKTSVTKTFQEDLSATQAQEIDGQWWGIFPQLVVQYAPSMSLQDIYKNYRQYAGSTPEEDSAQMRELYTWARGQDVGGF